MSKQFLEFDPNDKVKLKSLFYAMRTSLAATWTREKGKIPPVLFSELLELVSEETKEKIVDLMKLKESKNEDFLYLMDASLYKTFEKVIEKNEAEKERYAYGYFKNGVSIRTNKYRLTKYYRNAQPTIELYNHLKDPYETTNIASDYPEIVKKLLPTLEKGNTGLYKN